MGQVLRALSKWEAQKVLEQTETRVEAGRPGGGGAGGSAQGRGRRGGKRTGRGALRAWGR